MIDWDKPIQRRDGGWAAVEIDAKPSGKFIVSRKKNGSLAGYCVWADTGLINARQENPGDIINVPEKKKLTGWVNVYAGRDVLNIYGSKEVADMSQYPTGNRVACIDLTKYNIEYVEGEGLDD